MSTQAAPENKTFGLALTAAGGVFTLLGILLFFNASLLALGNLFLVVGVSTLVGPSEVFAFASQPVKRKGSGFVLGGFILVLYKWGLIGLLLEAYGFFELFGDLIPGVLNMLRQIPVIGQYLSPPAPVEQRADTPAAQFVNQLLGSLNRPQTAGTGQQTLVGTLGGLASAYMNKKTQ
ncbi:Got1-domain-containing protein [Meredithblackwellia eburnea MCA 4105]